MNKYSQIYTKELNKKLNDGSLMSATTKVAEPNPCYKLAFVGSQSAAQQSPGQTNVPGASSASSLPSKPASAGMTPGSLVKPVVPGAVGTPRAMGPGMPAPVPARPLGSKTPGVLSNIPAPGQVPLAGNP